ncbi:hypothetical protein BsWGS_06408 [Bradybaena similaris]
MSFPPPSLSLSLSVSNTHTHTHTPPPPFPHPDLPTYLHFFCQKVDLSSCTSNRFSESVSCSTAVFLLHLLIRFHLSCPSSFESLQICPHHEHHPSLLAEFHVE